MDLKEAFLEGMSRAAATVSVVTTDGVAGRHGVTVSAMTALSADSAAPSLLVCINDKSAAASAIRANGNFCVNLLHVSQSHLSDVFAGRHKDRYIDKFDCGDWQRLATGAPAAPDAAAAFDCRLRQAQLYGTHWIFIGETEDIKLGQSDAALIYANRAYGKPTPLVSKARANPSAGTVTIGCSTNWGPFFMGGVAARLGAMFPEKTIEFVEGFQNVLVEALQNGEIECAITHDLKLPEGIATHHFADFPPYCLLPASLPLAEQSSVSLSDLVDLPLIVLDTPPVTEHLLGYFGALEDQPMISLRAHSLEMVRSLVGNGLGYSLLFSRPRTDTAYDGSMVVCRPLDATGLDPLSLVVATRAGAEDDPFHHALIEATLDASRSLSRAVGAGQRE